MTAQRFDQQVEQNRQKDAHGNRLVAEIVDGVPACFLQKSAAGGSGSLHICFDGMHIRILRNPAETAEVLFSNASIAQVYIHHITIGRKTQPGLPKRNAF